ncbi:MAG TPA: succinate dehydrogenase cytochrome b subunit [Myxococcota bacterium]|nr:succinate dehydrogenase cytochrome b subunit [Myxococcota bacterium]
MRVLAIFSSTIGKKFLVALTGLFMVVFLLLHLAGNLEIFSGQDAVNQYAAFLRTMPKVLWAFRIALIVAVVLHIYLTISLTTRNQNARKERYHLKRSRKATLSSRTMMLSGLTILAFVCYHLSHYTLGITNPEFMALTDAHGRHDVYNMMVMGFRNPLISGFYILAQILLAFHLSHGVSSTARTLGVSSAVLYDNIRVLGFIFAFVIAVLYISIPLSVLLGIVPVVS